jgi:hypothetical protein
VRSDSENFGLRLSPLYGVWLEKPLSLKMNRHIKYGSSTFALER